MTRHAKLGQIIDIRTGYLSRTKVKEAPDGRFCLIQLGDFDESRTTIDPRKLTRFDPGEMRKDQTIRPEEVLFLAKGVRNFAYHPGRLPLPTLAASCFYVLAPSDDITSEYLNWYLNHPHTTRVFDRIAGVGARMPVMKKSDLADMDVPLPPRSDQGKIVELHSLMTCEARLLEQLRERRKTFIDTVTMAIAQGDERKDANHA
jgi:restriction endonuclease S subunit